MDWQAHTLATHITNWLLITVRIGAFFTAAPFFSSDATPGKIKAYLAAVLSFCLYATGQITPVTEISGLWDLSFIGVKELSVGILLTFFAHLIYMPFRLVGIQLGNIGGFGRAFMMNPDEGEQFTVLQQFLYIVGVLLFFTLNGHHLILKTFILSFRYIPLGNIFLDGTIMKLLTQYFSKAFAQGIIFSAPIVGCVLINSLVFGILSKSMPQMNLLILDLPLRAFVALAGIIFAIPMMAAVFKKFLFYSNETLEQLIWIMSKGGVHA